MFVICLAITKEELAEAKAELEKMEEQLEQAKKDQVPEAEDLEQAKAKQVRQPGEGVDWVHPYLRMRL